MSRRDDEGNVASERVRHIDGGVYVTGHIHSEYYAYATVAIDGLDKYAYRDKDGNEHFIWCSYNPDSDALSMSEKIKNKTPLLFAFVITLPFLLVGFGILSSVLPSILRGNADIEAIGVLFVVLSLVFGLPVLVLCTSARQGRRYYKGAVLVDERDKAEIAAQITATQKAKECGTIIKCPHCSGTFVAEFVVECPLCNERLTIVSGAHRVYDTMPNVVRLRECTYCKGKYSSNFADGCPHCNSAIVER